MMTAPTTDYAEQVSGLMPICRLTPAAQAQVADTAEVLHYPRGAFVFREGDRDGYAYYLLEGKLELVSGGQTVQRIVGGAPDAACALAQLQPRKMSARAETDATVLRVARDLLDRLAAAEEASDGVDFQVDEIESADTDDWMTRLLRSPLFARLPAANIHRVFTRLETHPVEQGAVVVRQGDPGDFYYVIVSGRAEVVRAAAPNAPSYRLALIGAGDAFGEEAIIGNAERNATVRMLTAGELVRLGKEDFLDLIRNPLLSAVSRAEGDALVGARGAVWLDVRFPEEHAKGAIPGSLNLPLTTLRMHTGRLARERTYIVYCDDGTRSAVAAFLLAERGFDVHYLATGVGAASAHEIVEEAPDLSLHEADAESPVPARSGPLPKSHLTAAEHEAEPGVAAAALTVELANAELAVSRAEQAVVTAAPPRTGEPAIAPDAAVRAATEKARAEIARAAHKRIAEERARARAELEAARRAAEQAAEARLQEERQRYEQAAAEAREELERARAAATREAEERLEAERRRYAEEAEQARQELETARRQQEQIEQARAAAEAAVVRERQAQEEQEARIRAEVEAAQRLKAEIEQVRAAAEAEVARERRVREEEEARVRAELEAAQRQKEAVEQARAAAAAEAERERQAREAEEARARAELAAAQRLKEEIEQARAAAEAEMARERRAQQEKVAQVRAEMERRLREEEVRIKESYAWQAEEIARLQAQKQVAEARLREEQERVERQADEARARLAEAREFQQRLEQVEQASVAEAALREQQQLELERRLREELTHKAHAERQRLEAELAKNASELARARHEAAAAEAARRAAAEEAEHIVAEFKAAHARRRQEEEAEMRIERARLEAEAERLRLALELAQREKEVALADQERIAEEIAELRQRSERAGDDLGHDLEVLEAQADEAARHVADTERARADAQAAAVASAGDLAAHRVHEGQVRSALEEEIAEWLQEQSAQEESVTQRSILANQKAHLERIKQRASAARVAAKAHDQALLDELAERLRNSLDD